MNIRLLESAEQDLIKAYYFYEGLSSGVGRYFLDSVSSDIDSLLSTAGIHKSVYNFHRMLCKRFPFAVYYLIDGENIDIYAILDCRRSPKTIDRLLKKVIQKEY